jgi:SAM-dependent methyltransferase
MSGCLTGADRAFMDGDDIVTGPQPWGDWLETPLGSRVLAWEQACLDALVADVFGFNALQLGDVPVDFLRANRMPLRMRCTSSPSTLGTTPQAICAQPCALPLTSNSVDLVVLPHVLEFDPRPHDVLREAARILVPEGSLVVIGFNPYSLWGLRRRWGCGQHFPWQGRYIGLPRLKDWFALLGLEACAGEFGCHAPPIDALSWQQRFAFLDIAGVRWWGFAGGVYVIQAIKRVAGLRPILPRWRERMSRAKALISLAPPTPLPLPGARKAAGHDDAPMYPDRHE